MGPRKVVDTNFFGTKEGLAPDDIMICYVKIYPGSMKASATCSLKEWYEYQKTAKRTDNE